VKFVRKVANSDILANVIDIPKELKGKKVEIIILPYEEQKKKIVRGALARYKNEEFQEKEDEAWANTVVEKYENS